jgi:hypothetical protein
MVVAREVFPQPLHLFLVVGLIVTDTGPTIVMGGVGPVGLDHGVDGVAVDVDVGATAMLILLIEGVFLGIVQGPRNAGAAT